MTRFIDYAWWQVSPATLKSLGVSGVMRYISHDGSKDLSAAERDNLRAAGLDIGLVYESQANRAAQGFTAGSLDATFANNRADLLGYEGTLWYAVDFDTSAAVVQPYFDGIASVGRRKFAPYGSATIIENVRYNGIGWQTEAWSRGRVSARAGLIQDIFNNTYDSNKVLIADFGQWKAHEVIVVVPPEYSTIAVLEATL